MPRRKDGKFINLKLERAKNMTVEKLIAKILLEHNKKVYKQDVLNHMVDFISAREDEFIESLLKES